MPEGGGNNQEGTLPNSQKTTTFDGGILESTHSARTAFSAHLLTRNHHRYCYLLFHPLNVYWFQCFVSWPQSPQDEMGATQNKQTNKYWRAEMVGDKQSVRYCLDCHNFSTQSIKIYRLFHSCYYFFIFMCKLLIWGSRSTSVLHSITYLLPHSTFYPTFMQNVLYFKPHCHKHVRVC